MKTALVANHFSIEFCFVFGAFDVLLKLSQQFSLKITLVLILLKIEYKMKQIFSRLNLYCTLYYRHNLK